MRSFDFRPIYGICALCAQKKVIYLYYEYDDNKQNHKSLYVYIQNNERTMV